MITGSFSFKKAAGENNAENLLIIHDKILVSLYTKNWHYYARHLEVYTGQRAIEYDWQRKDNLSGRVGSGIGNSVINRWFGKNQGREFGGSH